MVLGTPARKMQMGSNYILNYIKLSNYIRLYPKMYNNLSFARLSAPKAYPRVVYKSIRGVVEKMKLRCWQGLWPLM